MNTKNEIYDAGICLIFKNTKIFVILNASIRRLDIWIIIDMQYLYDKSI